MINERIKNDIKQAMIDKDEVKKNTLKMVVNKANAQAKDIALKNKTEIELTDEVMIAAINKEFKQVEETIAMIESNGKTDSELYANSVKARAILAEYLPKQLTEEELDVEIRKLLEGIDTSNKGLVMKTVMGELKGKANGKLINTVTMKILNS